MFYFIPRWGFFLPFPHGTTSLSVTQEYLALQGGENEPTTHRQWLGLREPTRAVAKASLHRAIVTAYGPEPG